MHSKPGTYLKSHWRGIINLLTVAAMLGLIYVLRHDIVSTLKNVKHVNYWVLLLMIPLQLLDYDAYARMYRTILDYLRQPVRYRDMYRVALELNFVNHAFPSGGISGFSFFSLRLKSYGVTAGTATLLQLLKFIFIFVSFQLLIGFGLIALAVGGKASNVMILVSAVLATLTGVSIFLVAYVVGSKARIDSFFTGLTRGINRLIHYVRPRHPETINISGVRRFLEDIHDNFQLVRHNRGLLKKTFFYGLAANLCELLTLYVVYIAFNSWVNIGAVIIAYAIANFAGLVSVLPGGIGVYEALMTGVLVAGGVPASLSIPVVVMYRVLSMSLQLLPGWVLYQQSLKRGGQNA